VTQADRIHPGDIFIASLVVASQIAIARYLFRGRLRKLPRAASRAIVAVLSCVWFGCAVNILLEIVAFWRPHLLNLPPVAGGILSATEILWGIVSVSAIAVGLVYNFAVQRLPAAHAPERRRLVRAAAMAAMAAPAAAVGFGAFVERTRFYVKEVDLPVPNLHPDLAGMRIAQISDLHVSPYLSVRDAGRVVDIANELRPLLTLVTGDLISEPGDPLDATIRELARLRADEGVLGCLGNHEVYAECEDYATEQARRFGIVFLRAEAHALRRGNGVLNVAGVDYQPFYKRARYLTGADKLIVPGAANLLLSHNPDVFPVAVRQGFDAVVSGHTHGGQVTVEILNQTLNLARFFTPYVAGLYRMNGRSCYVTAGIGTIGMPVRIGAPPEITLLRLRAA